jgi:hypothetical protein
MTVGEDSGADPITHALVKVQLKLIFGRIRSFAA